MVVALFAGCGGAPTVWAPADAVDPWPMFRREPRHGGDARDRGRLTWEVAWQVELDERVDASPIVVAGGVVVATRKGTVVLLDPTTGDERARMALGGDVWATPAAARGVIVLGMRRGGAGELIGLDARSLGVRWRRGVASGGFGAATVDGGAVRACNGEALVSVDAGDGRERARWPLGARCFGAPAIDGETIYVASRAGELRAYDRARGVERWRAVTSAGVANDSGPVVADGVVMIGSNDGHMYGFGTDGAPRWRVGDGDWTVSSPAIAAGLAVFGDDGDVVRAVRITDGTEVWRGEVGGDVASSAVVVGEHVVHGAHDGKVHAWRLRDGEPREAIDAGGKMFASPAVTAEGMVVIATHAGRVVAIR